MNKTLVFLHPHLLKRSGASMVVLEQAKYLSQKGIDCVIVTIKSSNKVTQDYKGLKIIELGGLTTNQVLFWFLFPLFWFRLEKILKRFPNKILFAHSLAIYWGGLWKFFYRNTKLICYIHDLGMPFTDSRWEKASFSLAQKAAAIISSPLFCVFNKWIINNSDFVVSNSKTSSSWIFKKYGRRSDLVVPPGVDTKVFKPLSKKENVLISVGRLEKIKNFELAIKGFAEYKKTNPSSELVLKIVGDGSEKKHLKSLTKDLKLEKEVFFVGEMSREKLATLFGSSKVSILLGDKESFGLVAAESISCRTPVLGLKKGGVGEIIKTTNYGVFVKKNAASVARGIQKALNFKHKKIFLDLSWEKKLKGFYMWIVKTYE